MNRSQRTASHLIKLFLVVSLKTEDAGSPALPKNAIGGKIEDNKKNKGHVAVNARNVY